MNAPQEPADEDLDTGVLCLFALASLIGLLVGHINRGLEVGPTHYPALAKQSFDVAQAMLDELDRREQGAA